MPVTKIFTTGGGGGGGGGSSNSFSIWQSGSDQMVATSPTDIATFTSSDASVTITIDPITDTIDFVAGGGGITELTGEVTAGPGSGSQAATVTNSAVIGKVLTGLSAGNTVIAATDTILQGFGKAVSSNFTSGTASRIAVFNGTSGKLLNQHAAVSATSNGFAATGDFQLFSNGVGTQPFTLNVAYLMLGIGGSTVFNLNLGATGANAGTTALASLTTQPNSGGTTTSLDIGPGQAGTSAVTNSAGSITVHGGNTNTATTSGTPGSLTLSGGNHANAAGSGNGATVTTQGGNAAGSGTGGNAIIQGGTSASGTAGVVQIGRTSTTDKNILNNALGTPASDALTLLNGPSGTAGNPDGYLLVTINGTDSYIPFWNA